MKVNIVDVNRFIKANDCPEVTSPIYFDKGRMPTDDGLFSLTLFGRPGSFERKSVFGYIDLKMNFLHPLVYKNLIRINRKFIDVIAGNGYWEINEQGDLIESSNGETGIDFVYKNWEKIQYGSSDSVQRKERTDFLTGFKKSEAFMNKQIVIPPYYRDIDFSKAGSGKIAHDPINDMYAKLLRLTSTLNQNTDEMLGGLDFIGNISKHSIQMVLIDIYDYFTGKIEKKNGIFRQSVLGKSVDYSCRSVISASNYNQNSYKDLKVTFQSSGVPLCQVLVIFFPFTMKWLQDFFTKEYGMIKTIDYMNPKTKKIEKINIAKDAMDDFDYDHLKKKIDQFHKAPTERFEVIKIKTEKGYLPITWQGIDVEHGDTTITRHMTWTDLFFMCACDITKDKHVYITRYPLEDYFGIYPSRITVLSTFKTQKQIVSGREYEFYPVIDLSFNNKKEEIPNLFIDALQLFNSYLGGLGGDSIKDPLYSNI